MRPRRLKRLLLWLFQVDERPEPPPGSPESLRVFRASPKYFGYSVLKWAIGQASALLGLVVSVIGLASLPDGGVIDATGLGFVVDFLEDHALGAALWLRFTDTLAPLLIGLFVVQFVTSFSMLRLGYEMRWYMVSDRALRIRYGIYSLREQTMTVANIQNMAVKRGPLQRLFGIADLEIRTASGGGSDDDDEDSLNRGLLQGLDDAEEVRNLLMASLRQTRDSGLGDPDDEAALPAPAQQQLVARVGSAEAALVAGAERSTARRSPPPTGSASSITRPPESAAAREHEGSAVAAAGELLAELRALRRVLDAGTS